MRAARLLLLVSLAVGLAAIVYAWRSHMRALGFSLEESGERSLRADLRERARQAADRLRESLALQEPVALYDADGNLLRPAPPAVARPFATPPDSLSDWWLRRGDLERAWKAARTGAERARVLVRKGDFERALEEEEIRGTDLWYHLRQELADAEWIDDVSALLGGPSEPLARFLLKEAGAEPVGSRAERLYFAALHPAPGYSVRDGSAFHFDGRALRRVPVHSGTGPVTVPLPPPFEKVHVAGDLDRSELDADLARQSLGLLLPGGLAALVLLVGTVYAYVAIGRAVRLAEAKSDFVANVTHELKTPLANIRLYGESLRAGRVRTEDQAEFLDTLLEEAGRLDALVEGLLHAARGPRLEPEAVDLRGLLKEAEERWRPRLERDGYAFEVDAPELSPVRGDREALLRALSNLLDNARKYSGAARRIELSARNGEDHVRLTVRDHGPGIPVAMRKRVLEPFTRLESGDRKETPGAGLGLSLVVSCMEAHGGRVEIGDGDVSLVLPVGKP